MRERVVKDGQGGVSGAGGRFVDWRTPECYRGARGSPEPPGSRTDAREQAARGAGSAERAARPERRLGAGGSRRRALSRGPAGGAAWSVCAPPERSCAARARSSPAESLPAPPAARDPAASALAATMRPEDGELSGPAARACARFPAGEEA
ncbi:unnamed protein product [Rangifer tarandus platyrhynchus]|uniref:Uncharacterized protein n=1 Tax=Rangifer tarandus platyrhynchus TaxID=3082113 RepID=A0ABN8XYT1_RANTA|nr:unnamed protein product [Rangifer tarandus platyrhynchus]